MRVATIQGLKKTKSITYDPAFQERITPLRER